MKRVEYVDDILQRNKYVLEEEYAGFGIYERITPYGYRCNQDWLIVCGRTCVKLLIRSFNDFCLEEVKDLIDNYNRNGMFGVHGSYLGGNLYQVHNNFLTTI